MFENNWFNIYNNLLNIFFFYRAYLRLSLILRYVIIVFMIAFRLSCIIWSWEARVLKHWRAGQFTNGRIHRSTTNSCVANVLGPSLRQFPDHSRLLSCSRQREPRPRCGASRVCYASEIHRSFSARRTRLFGIRRAIVTAVVAASGVQSARQGETIVIHDNRWMLQGREHWCVTLNSIVWI